VLDAGDSRFVTSGRVAIALALRAHGIGLGDRVLLPAYHCTSMVEPVAWTGATPVFYRMHPDTRPDLDDIASKCSAGARALIVTHYFGFTQDMLKFRSLCDKHGLLLIEDCAHAFFGSVGNHAVGALGDYAIASAMKFFPLYDGGVLVSSRHSLAGIDLHANTFRFEMKSALNILEHAVQYGRLRPFAMPLRTLMRAKDAVWSSLKRRSPDAHVATAPIAADGAYEFDPSWLDKRMTRASRVVLSASARLRIVERRRENYNHLLAELGSLRGATPLFPQLPTHVVPYVFPLRMEAPEHVFPLLKQGGVPILRFGEYLWSGVDAQVCAVTADLSRRVFQFPCHQELRQHELDWIIARVRAALT
jgi:dTDP-4-amino-4,6-dideoxygalactose transaminase